MLCTRPFMSLCGLADGCISTSVIEGFGYALYEPWLYGRGVIGRMPEGFSAAGGIRVPQLYDAMLLPAAWIDSNSDARRRPRRWPAGVVRDGCVDFACLDFRTQCGILCRLARQPEDLRCIAFLKGKAVTPLAPAAAGGRLIARNAARIRAKLGEQAFTAGFGKCFLGSGVLPQGSIITHAALRRAGDERFWRLLGGGREDV